MSRLETTVIIERDMHDSNKYTVTVNPGNEYVKIEIETSFHLMRASNLPYHIKRGTTQKHYFQDIYDFLCTLASSKLTTEIVTALLHKVLLLLNLN